MYIESQLVYWRAEYYISKKKDESLNRHALTYVTFFFVQNVRCNLLAMVYKLPPSTFLKPNKEHGINYMS